MDLNKLHLSLGVAHSTYGYQSAFLAFDIGIVRITVEEPTIVKLSTSYCIDRLVFL
jgi:hypothetical protein